jgi:hypothetical protein
MAEKEIPRNRWNVESGSSPLRGPYGTEMFPCKSPFYVVNFGELQVGKRE